MNNAREISALPYYRMKGQYLSCKRIVYSLANAKYYLRYELFRMYTPILEYRVLECHILCYTYVNFNTFARLKIDQTLVFKLPVGSTAKGYEWNFCYSPTTYHHFSDGWHAYYSEKKIFFVFPLQVYGS